jgi:hypothetical protein
MKSQNWKPTVLVWRWEDAPKEFMGMSPFGDGMEESVIYVPPELIEDGDFFPSTALSQKSRQLTDASTGN